MIELRTAIPTHWTLSGDEYPFQILHGSSVLYSANESTLFLKCVFLGPGLYNYKSAKFQPLVLGRIGPLRPFPFLL